MIKDGTVVNQCKTVVMWVEINLKCSWFKLVLEWFDYSLQENLEVKQTYLLTNSETKEPFQKSQCTIF